MDLFPKEEPSPLDIKPTEKICPSCFLVKPCECDD